MADVRYIVVHCTATPEGRDVSAAEVRRWHKDRGWRDIGYHALVRLDGAVEIGRPINEDDHLDQWEIGAHVKGYNRHSVGIAYVGGVDREGRPTDTRTPAQRAALYAMIERFKRQFPTARVVGHNRLDPGKACPSYDAEADWLAYQSSLGMPPPPTEKPRPLMETGTGQAGARGAASAVAIGVATLAENADAVIGVASDPTFRLVTEGIQWAAYVLAALALAALALKLFRKHQHEQAKAE